MDFKLYLTLTLSLISCLGSSWGHREGSPPPYYESYIEQQVDHFNYVNLDTFKERYLTSGKDLS